MTTDWLGPTTAGHWRRRTLETGVIEAWPVDGQPFTPVTTDAERKILDKCASRWLPLVEQHASAAGVPVAWVLGVMCAESGGDPNAKSPAGAIGLLQLMPFWARGRDLWNPSTNIAISCSEAMGPLVRNGFDLVALASAYNAGPAKDGKGAKLSDRYLWGVMEEVPPHLRATTPWGSAYISRIVRCANTWTLEHPKAELPDSAPCSVWHFAPEY